MEKPDCQTSSSETVSKFRNNYIEVWNHKRSKFRRTNVTNLKTALSPFACYSMINLHFAVRSTYQSYKWLHGKIVEFYVKVRTKTLGPYTFGTRWPPETMNFGFWHCNCACRIYRAFVWLQYVRRSASIVRCQAPPLLPPRTVLLPVKHSEAETRRSESTWDTDIGESWTLRDSSVLGCGGVSLTVWLQTFRKTFETSVNTHPTTHSITSQNTWSLPLLEKLELLQFETNSGVNNKSDPPCSESSLYY